jgi:hypothetical protein
LQLIALRLGYNDPQEFEFYFVTDANFYKFLWKYLTAEDVQKLIASFSEEELKSINLASYKLLTSEVNRLTDNIVANKNVIDEIYNSINNDPSFYNTMQNYLNLKADLTYVDQRFDETIDNAPESLNTLNKLAQSINNDPAVFKTITDSIVETSNNLTDYIDASIKAESERSDKYTDTKLSELVGSSPDLLNTLKELADAINDDPNFATTVLNKIADTKTELTEYIDTSVSNEAERSNKYADDKVSEAIGDAPEDLDTLQKIADALNNDPDYYNTVITNLQTIKTELTELNNTTITQEQEEREAAISTAVHNIYVEVYGYDPTEPDDTDTDESESGDGSEEGEDGETTTKKKEVVEEAYNSLYKIQEILKTKVDQIEGKSLSTNDFTDEYKEKLDNIEENANAYVHPLTHPATMIEEDTTHRFITDDERTEWNLKYGGTSGSSQFTGNEGETKIAHGLGSMPSVVIIIPSENPDGYLGEYWVRKDSTYIYVGNSGSATTGFTWIAIR